MSAVGGRKRRALSPALDNEAVSTSNELERHVNQLLELMGTTTKVLTANAINTHRYHLCRVVDLEFSDYGCIERDAASAETNYHQLQIELLTNVLRRYPALCSLDVVVWIAAKILPILEIEYLESVVDSYATMVLSFVEAMSADDRTTFLGAIKTLLQDLMRVNEILGCVESSSEEDSTVSIFGDILQNVQTRISRNKEVAVRLHVVLLHCDSVEKWEAVHAAVTLCLEKALNLFPKSSKEEQLPFLFPTILKQLEIGGFDLKSAGLVLTQSLLKSREVPSMFTPFLIDHFLALLSRFAEAKMVKNEDAKKMEGQVTENTDAKEVKGRLRLGSCLAGCLSAAADLLSARSGTFSTTTKGLCIEWLRRLPLETCGLLPLGSLRGAVARFARAVISVVPLFHIDGTVDDGKDLIKQVERHFNRWFSMNQLFDNDGEAESYSDCLRELVTTGLKIDAKLSGSQFGTLAVTLLSSFISSAKQNIGVAQKDCLLRAALLFELALRCDTGRELTQQLADAVSKPRCLFAIVERIASVSGNVKIQTECLSALYRLLHSAILFSRMEMERRRKEQKETNEETDRQLIYLEIVSLPWVEGESGINTALKSKLPHAHKLSEFFGRISAAKATEIRRLSLRSLGAIDQHFDWRKRAFAICLNSSVWELIEEALNCLPFLLSMKNTQGWVNLMITKDVLCLLPMLQSSRPQLLEHTLLSVAKLICISSCHTTVQTACSKPDFMTLHCEGCERTLARDSNGVGTFATAMPIAKTLKPILNTLTGLKEDAFSSQLKCAVCQLTVAAFIHTNEEDEETIATLGQLQQIAVGFLTETEPKVKLAVLIAVDLCLSLELCCRRIFRERCDPMFHSTFLLFSESLPAIVCRKFAGPFILSIQKALCDLNSEANVSNAVWEYRYLTQIIKYCSDESVVAICLVKVLYLGTLQSKHAAYSTHGRKSLLLVAEDKNMRPMQLLEVYGLQLCKHVVKNLLHDVRNNLATSTDATRASAKKICVDLLTSLAALFGCGDKNKTPRRGESAVKHFFTIVCHKLVAWLALFADESAEVVLSAIAELMMVDPVYLKSSFCFPTVLLAYTLFGPQDSATKSSFFHFVLKQGGSVAETQQQGRDFESLVAMNGNSSARLLLTHLAYRDDDDTEESPYEKRIIDMVYEIANIVDRGDDARDLILADFLYGRIFGILLHFRECLCGDDPKPVKVQTIRSFIRLLQILQQEAKQKSEACSIIDESCAKLLIVLKAAIDENNLVYDTIEAFETLVKCLTVEQLDTNLIHIFAILLPKLALPELKPTVNYVFWRVKDALTNYPDLCFLLECDCPETADMRQHFVPSQLELKDAVSKCVKLLVAMDRADSKVLVLLRLRTLLRREAASLQLQMLDSNERLNWMVVELIQTLIATINESPQQKIRSLATNCLALLGAIDPGRLGLELSSVHGRALPSSLVNRQAQPVIFANFKPTEAQYNVDFAVELLERLVKSLQCVSDAREHDICSFTIQQVLDAMGCRSDDLRNKPGTFAHNIWNGICENSRSTVSPMLRTLYRDWQRSSDEYADQVPFIDQTVPFVYDTWIARWVSFAVSQVSFTAAKWLFTPLVSLAELDNSVGHYLMPHIVLEGLLENNPRFIQHAEAEILAVFRRCVEAPPLIEGDDKPVRGALIAATPAAAMAARTTFRIIDVLNQWHRKFSNQFLENEQMPHVATNAQQQAVGAEPIINIEYTANDLSRVSDFLRRVQVASSTGAEGDETSLICSAALACQSEERALRSLEVANCERNTTPTADLFSRIQCVYARLGESDGVSGALQRIKQSREPTASEWIAAYTSSGNYSEALPFHQVSSSTERNVDRQLGLMKCLLELDQPELVDHYIKGLSSEYLKLLSAQEKREVNSVQVEAAWKMQDWSRLDSYVNEAGSVSSRVRGWSWELSVGGLLSVMRAKDSVAFDDWLQDARDNLLASLVATTMENASTYARAYPIICRLNILMEVEEAANLWVFDRDPRRKDNHNRDDSLLITANNTGFDHWNSKSRLMQQTLKWIEPLSDVRRQLLRFAPQEAMADSQTHKMWLDCARVARVSDHLQTAWSYIVKAKQTQHCNPVCHFIEEARLSWERGEQIEAIGTLETGLAKHFSADFALTAASANSSLPVDASFARKRVLFARAQVLLADYSHQAATKDLSQISAIYDTIIKTDQTEFAQYQLATFRDQTAFKYRNIRTISDLLKCDDFEKTMLEIVNCYGEVLRFGSRYIHHVMPRLIDLWLEGTKQAYLKQQSQNAASSSSSSDSTKATQLLSTFDTDATQPEYPPVVLRLNDAIRALFDRLPPCLWYTAFSQLISRIDHLCEPVFETLKHILVELILHYPHQCLWLSIGIYRSMDKDKSRATRCKDIFDEAKKRNRQCNGQFDVQTMIATLLQLSSGLMTLAVKRDPIKRNSKYTLSMAKQNPELFRLVMNRAGSKNTTKSGKSDESSSERSSDQKWAEIMIPHQSFMEMRLPSQIPVGPDSVSTQNSSLTSSQSSIGNFPELVFIRGFSDKVEVQMSKEAPKRVEILGSDGNHYPLLAKANDDLRKDKRFVEFNMVVNSCLRQDPEARRRQLYSRTYSVIPLGAEGGLVEWVPNLVSFRDALMPLVPLKGVKVMTRDELFSPANNLSKHATSNEKLQHFRNLKARHPAVMTDWFLRSFTDPSGWYAARLAFTRTTAAMSMVGFVVGLGDRHAENVLLDKRTGDVVHVDYNLLFNAGRNLAIPELVPFRLTHNMVDGFGPLGIEGPFRKACEVILKVLRDNKVMLLTILQAFIHDPLLLWQDRSHAQQEKLSKRKKAVDTGLPPMMAPAEGELDAGAKQAKLALTLFQSRLDGVLETSGDKSSTRGMPGWEMSVEGHVDQLIIDATDELLLSVMFRGWTPFL